jgi:hypothetical protein
MSPAGRPASMSSYGCLGHRRCRPCATRGRDDLAVTRSTHRGVATHTRALAACSVAKHTRVRPLRLEKGVMSVPSQTAGRSAAGGRWGSGGLVAWSIQDRCASARQSTPADRAALSRRAAHHGTGASVPPGTEARKAVMRQRTTVHSGPASRSRGSLVQGHPWARRPGARRPAARCGGRGRRTTSRCLSARGESQGRG